MVNFRGNAGIRYSILLFIKKVKNCIYISQMFTAKITINAFYYILCTVITPACEVYLNAKVKLKINSFTMESVQISIK